MPAVERRIAAALPRPKAAARKQTPTASKKLERTESFLSERLLFFSTQKAGRFESVGFFILRASVMYFG
jgi:hypothetical protein